MACMQAPVASRLHGIIPFLTFSTREQGVVVRQYTLTYARDLVMPPNSERRMGSIKMAFSREVSSGDGVVSRGGTDAQSEEHWHAWQKNSHTMDRGCEGVRVI